MTRKTVDFDTDRFWDLRVARRPTIWLVKQVELATKNPLGAPQIRQVQMPAPTKGDSRESDESSEVRRWAA